MNRINRHDVYIHCLKLAKEILRRGNFEGQQIYIHVGAQKYWETELLRPYRPEKGIVSAIWLVVPWVLVEASSQIWVSQPTNIKI